MKLQFSISDDEGENENDNQNMGQPLVNKKINAFSDQKFASKALQKGMFNLRKQQEIIDYSQFQKIRVKPKPKIAIVEQREPPTQRDPQHQNQEQEEEEQEEEEESEEYEIQEKKEEEAQNQQESVKEEKPSNQASSKLVNKFYLSSSEQDKEQEQINEQDKKQQKSTPMIQPANKKMLQFDFDDQQEEEGEGEKKKENTLQKQQIPIHNITYSEITNMKSFVMGELPVNFKVTVLIKRCQSGLNIFWPQYEMMFSGDYGYIMTAKKKIGTATSNYHISTIKESVDVEHPEYMGKVRSNFSGSTFNVFSKGVRPTAQNADKKKVIRGVIATIKFKSQILSFSPREFQVYALDPFYKYTELQGINLYTQQQKPLDQLYHYHNFNSGKIHYFKTRTPVYHQKIKGYVLNFGGRIKQSSTKNFILQNPVTQKQVLMMGKTNQDVFRLDISSEMSPMIAMCIALANFDSKFISD